MAAEWFEMVAEWFAMAAEWFAMAAEWFEMAAELFSILSISHNVSDFTNIPKTIYIYISHVRTKKYTFVLNPNWHEAFSLSI